MSAVSAAAMVVVVTRALLRAIGAGTSRYCIHAKRASAHRGDVRACSVLCHRRVCIALLHSCPCRELRGAICVFLCVPLRNFGVLIGSRQQ